MSVEVQLFAAARDAAGQSPLKIRLPPQATVAELRSALISTAPALKPLADTLLVAVNNQFATDDQVVQPGDEVACFPPVSGG
ncbi:MAG: molybdopterin converting factor subunit 1 [Fuerstiella sp.]